VPQPDASGERAGHLAGAGDQPAAAVAYAAARERLDRFATREAARLAGAGLRLDPADGPTTDLLEVRAAARERDGDRDGARADLRAALTFAGSPRIRSRLLVRLASLAVGSDHRAASPGHRPAGRR
jgi:hypothetical protein